MDIEKVIAWLADEELYYRDHGDTHNSLMACNAIALLKEQKAVAIVWKFGFPHCPVCGQMLPEGDAVKYCLHCGRSVKCNA